MASDRIEETLAVVREGTKSWQDAMHRGRMLVEMAARDDDPAHGAARLREAARQFQDAVGIDPDRDEAFGWLARALRLLAQAIRDRDAETAGFYLRCAAAAAWEGRCRTAPTSLSVFTKQEAKALLAWLRATRRLDPTDGEREMNALRVEFLTSALDPDTIALGPGA